MATLYEMQEPVKALYTYLEQGLIDEQTFEDNLEGLEVDKKVEGYCQIINQLKADAEMYKAEKERMNSRKTTCENGIKRMKERLLEFLETTGMKSYQAGTFKVSQATNQPSVKIEEGYIEKLPERFLVTKIEPDKNLIKEYLNEGNTLDGVSLTTSKSIRIR